jgi:hypothetical protein
VGLLTRELSQDALWAKVPPPLLSVLTIGLAFVFEYLLGVGDTMNTEQSRAFVASVPWTVWRSVSAAALVIFILLTVQAIRILRLPHNWGFHPERLRQRNRARIEHLLHLDMAIVRNPLTLIGVLAPLAVSPRRLPARDRELIERRETRLSRGRGGRGPRGGAAAGRLWVACGGPASLPGAAR